VPGTWRFAQATQTGQSFIAALRTLISRRSNRSCGALGLLVRAPTLLALATISAGCGGASEGSGVGRDTTATATTAQSKQLAALWRKLERSASRVCPSFIQRARQAVPYRHRALRGIFLRGGCELDQEARRFKDSAFAAAFCSLLSDPLLERNVRKDPFGKRPWPAVLRAEHITVSQATRAYIQGKEFECSLLHLK